MATANDILNIAKAEIGTKEFPADSNNVKYNTWYYGHEVSGANYPWCCVWVSYVFNKAGAINLIKKSALCMDLGQWFKNNNQWYSSPIPGDVVFFKSPRNSRWTNHVGIVLEVNSDGSITTIEGNTSSTSADNGGCVMKCKRTSWVGFGRPKYSSAVNYIYGVDISAYNKITNYDALKNAGVQFAVLRSITKGLKTDTLWETHLKGCDAAKIDVSAYVYQYAKNEQEARAEADALIKLLKGRKMQIWYDVEDQAIANQIGKLALTSVIRAFVSTMNASGYDVGLYTGMSFAKTYIDSTLFNSMKKWIARYGKNTYTSFEQIDNSYKPNMGEIAWQFSSNGYIPNACAGKLDLNVLYGTKSSTNTVVKTTTSTPYERIIYIDANTLNVRDAAGTHGNIKKVYKRGDLIEVVAKVDGWYKTNEGNYISANVKYSHEVVGTVYNCNALNARSTPSSVDKSNILFTLKPGDKVRPIKRNGEWIQSYLSDGSKIWTNLKYIRIN